MLSRTRAVGWAAVAGLLLAAGATCKKDGGGDPDAAVLLRIRLTITSVAPTIGPTAGGTLVTLTGTGFQQAKVSSVDFGGTLGTGLVLVSDTVCTVTTPAAAAGTVNVTVRGKAGLSATEAGGYLYYAVTPPAPTLAAIAPTFGLTTGGQAVTVTGTGFQAGATLDLGGATATGLVVHGASRCSGLTPAHAPGAVTVTLTNPDLQSSALVGGYTFVSPDAQTSAYVFDTSAGIDCRRRWFVNFNHNAFLKDLQNLGLQSWGTPKDASAPPVPLQPVDVLARDWVRAYVLRTLNIACGRNGDGTKVSGTSLNVTFVGLAPTSGSVGCATPSTDFGTVCVGGCDPGGNGGPHPSATQASCNLGAVGASVFDTFGGAACNLTAERTCDATYHACGGCGSTGTGIFTSLIVNIWGASLPGGRLTASDLPYLDGTITSGVRYVLIHDFMKQFARRAAFIIAHECGHAMGLVASGTGSPCTGNMTTGLCGGSPFHNDCCTTNVMQTAAAWIGPGLLTDTSIAFSGQPGSVSASPTCSTGGTSSWALLQAFVGTSP